VSDDLSAAYERELAIMGDLAAEFAARHPKIAARLSLGADDSRDPHVERLLQGFAFLAARIHKRLDDDFPELTEALLGAIYPHYLRPVPSMMIVEMGFDPAQAASTDPYRVPRGTTIETEPVELVDEPCTYRTCFDVPVQPVRVAAVKLAGPPFRLPMVPPPGTASVLTIEVETFSESVTVDQLSLFPLRLHLHAGSGKTANLLYERLLTKCLGVVVSGDADPTVSRFFPAENVTPAGFSDDEGAIPCDARSFPGYRLLTEFFALPRKFLFVDLTDPDSISKGLQGRRLTLSFLLGSSDRDLERSVGRDTVRLGCTPAVNLFPLELDPVAIDGRAGEVCLTPDVRRPYALEVHAVTDVRLLDSDGARGVLPLHAAGAGRFRSDPRGKPGLWWTMVRRPRSLPRPDGTFDHATDVRMSIVDEQGGAVSCVDRTLMVKAECLNRNLPGRLPFADGRPALKLPEGNGPLGVIRCLHKPTQTLRLDMGRGLAWRLVSHLSLNHLSLIDGGNDAAAAMKEVIGLYLMDEMDDFEQKRRWVEGIVGISGRRVPARSPGPRGGVVQGVEVRLQLDEDSFADGTAFLFSSVLERFLGAWVSVNSFTRLVTTSRQRESRGEEWRWPPRAGNQVLA